MSVVSPSSVESPKDEVAEDWCSTLVNVTKFSYTWTINNFSLCREETGEILKSSTFPVSVRNTLQWYLAIYPKGIKEEYKDYISLFLTSRNKSEVRTKYKLSILDDDQEERNVLHCSHRFIQEGKMWGYRKFISWNLLLDRANKLLTDDKLIVHCEISAITDPINICALQIPQRFEIPQCSLLNDIEQLFESQRFSDFILSVNGRDFFVHKTILALHSPVFAAMFEHEMEEKSHSRVEITDISETVMKEILRYVYTGKVPWLKLMADDLLAAADKYALDRLKAICEEAIYANISVDTAVDILVLADLHSADQLKAQTMDFMTLHATEVMATSGWKTMVKQHPHLFADGLQILANQYSSSFEPPRKKSKKN